LIVPWIQVAPARTAATAEAVATPKSLCPWKWTGSPSTYCSVAPTRSVDSLRGSDAERVDDGDLLRTGFNRRLVDLIAAVQLRVSQELVVGRCVHVALCQGNAGMNPRFSLR